jgi:hypothetical protein
MELMTDCGLLANRLGEVLTLQPVSYPSQELENPLSQCEAKRLAPSTRITFIVAIILTRKISLTPTSSICGFFSGSAIVLDAGDVAAAGCARRKRSVIAILCGRVYLWHLFTAFKEFVRDRTASDWGLQSSYKHPNLSPRCRHTRCRISPALQTPCPENSSMPSWYVTLSTMRHHVERAAAVGECPVAAKLRPPKA